MSKNTNFCHLKEIYLINMEKILDTVTKAGLGSCKNGNQEIVHKTAEATGKLIENKIAEKFL